MSNKEKASEFAAMAEQLLAKAKAEDVDSRQGFNPRETAAAQVAGAYASLAVYYAGLKSEK